MVTSGVSLVGAGGMLAWRIAPREDRQADKLEGKANQVEETLAEMNDMNPEDNVISELTGDENNEIDRIANAFDGLSENNIDSNQKEVGGMVDQLITTWENGGGYDNGAGGMQAELLNNGEVVQYRVNEGGLELYKDINYLADEYTSSANNSKLSGYVSILGGGLIGTVGACKMWENRKAIPDYLAERSGGKTQNEVSG